MAREMALRALYMVEQQRGAEKEPRGDEKDALELFFEQNTAQTGDDDYTRSLVNGVLANMEKIDAHIVEASEHWKLHRISRVDRNVLRVAVYEMCFEASAPAPVSIDEAVSIARRYGGEDSPAFVNGVLDKIRKNLDGPSPG